MGFCIRAQNLYRKGFLGYLMGLAFELRADFVSLFLDARRVFLFIHPVVLHVQIGTEY